MQHKIRFEVPDECIDIMKSLCPTATVVSNGTSYIVVEEEDVTATIEIFNSHGCRIITVHCPPGKIIREPKLK